MRDEKRGIQSVETGGRVLLVLMHAMQPLALKDIAEAAEMPSASVYPYLVSLVRVGLVAHNKSTGRYDLGPVSMQLGVASMRRLDSVRIATEGVVALAMATGKYVALSVWGSFGPTVIRIEEGLGTLYLNMRIGTVMSLTKTATGRVFAAYLPTPELKRFLERRDRDGATEKMTDQDLDHIIDAVKKRGFDRALGAPVPGAYAFSAPVFDYTGRIAFAVTIMGPEGEFDHRWASPLALQLLECTRGISHGLGNLPQGT